MTIETEIDQLIEAQHKLQQIRVVLGVDEGGQDANTVMAITHLEQIIDDRLVMEYDQQEEAMEA